MKTRDESLALLHEYTKSESLLKHAYSVEASMRWYAKHFEQSEQDIERWATAGLLHDFDYEMYPEPVAPDGHPFKGSEILKAAGYDQEIRDAIMGHADYTGVARETLMAKALFAVDELSGLIIAATLVRPDKSLNSLELKSVKKKLKDKAFARGCNREDIINGAIELEIDLDQHISNVILAQREVADQLGLA